MIVEVLNRQVIGHILLSSNNNAWVDDFFFLKSVVEDNDRLPIRNLPLVANLLVVGDRLRRGSPERTLFVGALERLFRPSFDVFLVVPLHFVFVVGSEAMGVEIAAVFEGLVALLVLRQGLK